MDRWIGSVKGEEEEKNRRRVRGECFVKFIVMFVIKKNCLKVL